MKNDDSFLPMTPKYLLAVVAVLTILANSVLLSPVTLVVRALAILLLTTGVPGLLLFSSIFPLRQHRGETSLESLCLIGGLGFAWIILISLVYSYLPGGMPFWGTLILFNVTNIVLLFLSWRINSLKAVSPSFPPQTDSSKQSDMLWAVAGTVCLLLVAGSLRFTNLGYAEFQGDEARAMLRAAAVIQGYEDVLFIHRKGPTEILLPAALYSLLGRIDEATARLPFAVANLLGLLAIFALGWRLLGAWTGWIGAMLLALDGYFVAFARIVQYQSIVFLMSVLIVWLLYRSVETSDSSRRYLFVAAALGAVGLLSHYEALMVVFPASMLFFHALKSNGKLPWTWSSIGVACTILLAIAFLFYVPFLLNPTFADTFRYLSSSRIGVGGQFPYNNLADFWTRSTLYSPSLYIGLLGLFGLLSPVLIYYRLRGGASVPAAVWMLAMWWLGPFALAMFVTADPRTHVYTAFFGWSLLVAWVVTSFGSRIIERAANSNRHFGVATATAALIGVAFVTYCANYGYWYFVHVENEVLRNWDTDRPSGYPVTYEVPSPQGIFAFPMRNGWKAIEGLYAEGMLDGSYLTNTKAHIVNWYLRDVDFCTRNHRYYFFAEDNNLYKREEYQELRRQLQEQYSHWGVILVNGQPRLDIYERNNADIGDPLYFTSQHFEFDYLQNHSTPYFDIGEPIVTAQKSPLLSEQSDIRFGDSIRLLGYAIEPVSTIQGGSVLATLYWRAEAAVDQNLMVFNQIIDTATNRKVGQLDGQPGCESRPTSTWSPGEVIVDRYRVPIFDDAPPGEYPLLVGLYNPDDMGRLEAFDQTGQPLGSAVTIGQIRVD